MSDNAYELLALGMRYVFAGLMILIVLRAWRISVIDSRRAKRLRRLSPETGIIGELYVIEGDGRARRGMHYPLTLEGTIGSARSADIRIHHNSVRPRHAFYQMTEEGLFVRGHAQARLTDETGAVMRETVLHDGDSFGIGRIRLMLILSEADATPEEISRRVMRRHSEAPEHRLRENNEADPLFEPVQDADELFAGNPAAGMGREENYDHPFEIADEEEGRRHR